MKTVFVAARAALLLFACSAGASAAQGMSLDTSGDAAVDADELHDLVRQLIEPFDDDDDAALRPFEFHEMVFHMWDANQNLVIEPDEFTRMRDWDSGLEPYDFARLDGDVNGVLGPLEFRSYQDLAMYEAWDVNANGVIDQFEISAGLVAMFDVDGNDRLEAGELENMPLPLPGGPVN